MSARGAGRAAGRAGALAAAGVLLTLAAACASFWQTPQARDAAQELACVEDASSRAAADQCRCRVREDYPLAPQCAVLSDGGVVLPEFAGGEGGASP